MISTRQQGMLEDMGLKLLQPRFLLPGAKEPVLLVPEEICQSDTTESGCFPEEAILSSAGDSAAIDNPHKNVLEVEIVDVVQAAEAMPNIRAMAQWEEKAQPAVLPEPTGSPAALKFRHRAIRVGNFLMVVDQPTLEWADAPRFKAFFSNLHVALTGKRVEFWHESCFDWPPGKQFPQAGNKDMARESFHAFLQEGMAQYPCHWIMLWGKRVIQSSLPGDMEPGQSAFVNDLPVVLLEDCRLYWQEPLRKKLLWQELQAVRKSYRPDTHGHGQSS